MLLVLLIALGQTVKLSEPLNFLFIIKIIGDFFSFPSDLTYNV